jgi:CBS domain-containing protein
MLKVKDIMTARVFSVFSDESALAAADSLSEQRVSGAPVRDVDGKFVGMFTTTDVVNRRVTEGYHGRVMVTDVMTPDVLAVYTEDPAISAATTMAEHDIHRVLVLDEEGTVTGIVTSMDIVKALARGASFGVQDDVTVVRAAAR